jgi:guanylate kinase
LRLFSPLLVIAFILSSPPPTESAEEQQRRLETGKVELAAEPEFDHTVINDDVRRAADELVSLMGLTPHPHLPEPSAR